MGLGGAAFPVEPKALRGGSSGFETAGLLGFDMNYDSFRSKVWEAYFLADYEVRYWKSIESRVQWIDVGIKALLALGSVISVAGFMTAEKYMWASTLLSVVCGLIATVLIPVLGLDNCVQKIVGLRNRWIDVRNGYQIIWDELDENNWEKSKRAFEKWAEIDNELEQTFYLIPTIDKLREKAFSESEKFLLSA